MITWEQYGFGKDIGLIEHFPKGCHTEIISNLHQNVEVSKVLIEAVNLENALLLMNG